MNPSRVYKPPAPKISSSVQRAQFRARQDGKCGCCATKYLVGRMVAFERHDAVRFLILAEHIDPQFVEGQQIP